MQSIIYMGSDHAGFKAKEELKNYLKGKGYEVTDLGCFSEDPCDYPDIAREVGEKLHEVADSRGVLICGSGIGISIAANKMRGVRCALVYEPELVETAREHNNVNCVAFGARYVHVEKMKAMLDKFLETKFDADVERHARRVEKMNNM